MKLINLLAPFIFAAFLLGSSLVVLKVAEHYVPAQQASTIKTEHELQTDFLVAYILSKECSTGNCGTTSVDPLAYGPAQFHRRTFNWMKGLAGKPQLQWKNGQDQRWLLRWALENGYGVHWGKNYYRGLRAYYERKR